MKPTQLSAGVPPADFILPPIDAVRPACCPECGAIAQTSHALQLWGHGPRERPVVVPGDTSGRCVKVWVRRFKCTVCGVTSSVSPAEVLARHRYTLSAILTAWCFAVARPVGDGRPDEAVYALVGVDRRLPGPELHRSGGWRWRSLSRWTLAIARWWPSRPVVGHTWRQRAGALIAGFVPGDGGRGGAIRRALAAHTAGGTAV